MKRVKKFSKLLFVTLIVVAGLFLASCTVRRSEPIQEPLAMNEAIKNGQIHYMANCQKCHPQGESGLGPAINSNPAPQFIKRFQVRHGLGAMPSFSKEEISKEELRDISAYLVALKRNK